MGKKLLVSLAVMIAFLIGSYPTAQSGTDFRVDSVITNSISGLVIVKNRENDYSLKAISGDGTKNVTLIRYAGSSAEADITVVYHLFAKQFEVLGVRP